MTRRIWWMALTAACACFLSAVGLAETVATHPGAKMAGSVPDTTVVDSIKGAHTVFPRPKADLPAKLRDGGYVLVFRHSITDWSQRDADVTNFEDRATQRNLSAEGVATAKAIGQSIAALKIPIGRVIASPMWRCRDTAQLAFGRHEVSNDLFQRGGQSRAVRVELMSTPTEKGKNLVLVTHQDVIIPIVAGLARDQLKEGEALIVKPLGDKKFEVVAQIGPEDWARLAAAAKPAR
ncbi:MAG TPA: histidine phosphatase family protein [Candidatus Eisenbacteria bacterium]|nr:histidine phosphatase family protein [Candidatus Eisenbacteria bacterium]